jgi:hypothetical protein
VNGKRVASVDLSSDSPVGERVVWSRNFDRARIRSVRVVSRGGPIVVGGFLVLR